MYESPESRRRRATKRLGASVFAAASVFAVGLAIILLWAFRGQVKLGEFGCPIGSGKIPELVAVVFDASEPYSPVQRRYIELTIRDLLLDAPIHTWFGLYVIDDNFTQPMPPKPQRCKPQLPANANEWTQNEKFLQADWEKFEGEFDEAFSAALATKEGSRSPIMEILQSVVLTGFAELDRQTSVGARRRIIIISDLLQNTDDVNHYGTRPPNFELFKKTSFFKHVSISLTNVEIEVFYANRRCCQIVQGKKHLEFWNAYFQAQGAVKLHFNVIPGSS